MFYSIAENFSKKPGLRFRYQTVNSGEEFREDYLIPVFDEAVQKQEILEINLDGTEGYTPSFLEESFGGLVRDRGVENVDQWLRIKSIETPYLVEDVKRFIKEAAEQAHG